MNRHKLRTTWKEETLSWLNGKWKVRKSYHLLVSVIKADVNKYNSSLTVESVSWSRLPWTDKKKLQLQCQSNGTCITLLPWVLHKYVFMAHLSLFASSCLHADDHEPKFFVRKTYYLFTYSVLLHMWDGWLYKHEKENSNVLYIYMAAYLKYITLGC